MRRLVENYADIMKRSQSIVRKSLENPSDSFSIVDPLAIGKAFNAAGMAMLQDPQALAARQVAWWGDYTRLVQSLWGPAASSGVAPGSFGLSNASETSLPESGEIKDRRFKDQVWAENAVFDFARRCYLLAARHAREGAESVDGLDAATREKFDFYLNQYVDAMSPSNFAASNPQVLRRTLETGGENLVHGLKQMLEDVERGGGELRVRMTDTDAFEPGVNVASAEGQVVYQNKLMQLIQYSPTTEKVHARPLLIVPPWINKFYILDLQPKNSFIRWAVGEGLTVFVVSWVNPDAAYADMDFEDYMKLGPLAALDAIEEATGEKTVNAIGYCIGGTLLGATLGYMKAKKDDRIASATFFACMLDFSEVGELSVFIDEEQIRRIERYSEKKGYLDGPQMASAFNLLRSNDLIWSFVINNYLMGEPPRAFDLLFWNSDATRMPKRMLSFYLRNMYQRNLLKEPGGITLDGEPIDIGKVTIPCYFVATHDDHIAPWKSSYMGAKVLGGGRKTRFVVGGSGHIAGIINPPAANKYGYRTNEAMPASPDDWFAGAEQHEGSWWNDWMAWMRPKSGRKVAARQPGDGKLEVIEPAPGSYVKVRV
ncbi:MAG: class I poly(R)-hydroxyalkanoic acid synthase [Gammaproteobacteria bacterium]|nr:MAG: class I poly(R)-hydroxyalkanoic acid synthase [Gammaproteobacteria bacterium]